ncbi:MAG: HTH domain-containing protein [Verrucomicrobia bacterium]|nr:HTH domain-containing protein [Verrucomicrobiota bacterium]
MNTEHSRIIHRLHRIFKIMKSADRALVSDVFAARLGVSTKTINRDMDRLRDFGADIESGFTGYRLMPNSPCPFCGGAFQ